MVGAGGVLILFVKSMSKRINNTVET